MAIAIDERHAEHEGTISPASLAVLRNTLYTFGSTVVSKGFIFGFVALGAKALGPEKWGVFTLAITLVTLLRVFTDFGFQILTTRDIAVRPAQLGTYLWNTTAIKFLLSVSSVAVTFLLLRVLQFEAVAVWVVILYSLALLPHSLYTSLLAVFNAQERMGTTGVLQLAASGVQFFFGIVILKWAPDVILLALSLPVAMAMASALGLFILGRSGVPSPKLRLDASSELLKVAWPFMVINLLTYTFQKADVLLLSVLRGDAEVGWYGAAYNFVDAIMFLPMAYTVAVFPRLSRIVHHEHKGLEVIVHRSLRHLFSLGCFFAITLAVFAHELILWVYKSAFANSATLLRILALGLIPMFPNSLFGYVLFSRGKQKDLVKLFVFNLSVNILLNSFAIPRYGALGAAATMLISLLFSFVCIVYITHKSLFPLKVFREISRPILIGIIYLFLLAVLHRWNAAISLIISVPTYLLLYWICGILGPEEKRIIQSLSLKTYQSLVLPFRKRARNAD